jgi:hypothetical protein
MTTMAEQLIADVQQRLDKGEPATIGQSRAMLELLARYRKSLKEIRALADDITSKISPQIADEQPPE